MYILNTIKVSQDVQLSSNTNEFLGYIAKQEVVFEKIINTLFSFSFQYVHVISPNLDICFFVETLENRYGSSHCFFFIFSHFGNYCYV